MVSKFNPLWLVFWILFPACSLQATPDELKQHLLVVYNRDAADSEMLARYYATKRGISDERLLGLSCSIEEQISRETYRKQILEPIDHYLTEKGWLQREPLLTASDSQVPILKASKNEIWVIALIKGVPLKISHETASVDEIIENRALATNAAAIDSELALLPLLGLPVTGFQRNPFYEAGYARSFDSLDAKEMVLVARLDGPKTEDVKRMIDDSLWAEENRLSGRAYIDVRGFKDSKDPYYAGDAWLRRSHQLLKRDGWDVEIDEKPELWPNNLPWSNVAIYAGWYTDTASGPFLQGERSFSPGAIAYHLHSFSASSLRTENKHWVGPFIAKGAAATMGAVYEPYLGFTPRIDIFLERLMQGYTFAEAAYMSQPVLSWMMTMVGDPLYCPMGRTLDDSLLANSKNAEFLEWQIFRKKLEGAEIAITDDSIQKSLQSPKATWISWENYADFLMEKGAQSASSCVTAYSKALDLSKTPKDQIRIGLKLIKGYEQQNEFKATYKILEDLLNRWPNESASYGVPAEVIRIGSLREAPPLPPNLLRYMNPSGK